MGSVPGILKVIVAPVVAFALRIACRSEFVPLSFVLATVNVVPLASGISHSVVQTVRILITVSRIFMEVPFRNWGDKV